MNKQFFKNVYYFLQSKFRFVFIGLFWFPNKWRNNFIEKVTKARPCFENSACLECGCDSIMMFMSDKPCPNKEEPCYLINNS